MPLAHPSSYRPPLLLHNGHLQTIYPSLFRKIEGVRYTRHRIETPDLDFLDLDVSSVGADRAAIVAHGLEGDSHRHYVLGMVRALNRGGWDAVAWNFRGCSGEPNRRARFYHSGDTDDLHTVIGHVEATMGYRQLALIGFSMGGNIVLKYLGERGKLAVSSVCAAATFSVPCHLHSAALKMSRWSNTLYMKRFLRMLHQKVSAKRERFPDEIDDRDFDSIRSFKDFDGRYTAPLHGFISAEDYWAKASSKPFLTRIAIPTLLVNALDDPFLAPLCFPYREAEKSPLFFFEAPKTGGHVGFIAFAGTREYWSESRAVEFLGSHAPVGEGPSR